MCKQVPIKTEKRTREKNHKSLTQTLTDGRIYKRTDGQTYEWAELQKEYTPNIHCMLEYDDNFLTFETEFILFFSGAGKFCLAHGLGRQM